MRDDSHAIDGRCPKCGGDVFRTIVGETSEKEIADYKWRKTMKIGPITWDPQWIPNGDYCYGCNWFDEKSKA